VVDGQNYTGDSIYHPLSVSTQDSREPRINLALANSCLRCFSTFLHASSTTPRSSPIAALGCVRILTDGGRSLSLHRHRHGSFAALSPCLPRGCASVRGLAKPFRTYPLVIEPAPRLIGTRHLSVSCTGWGAQVYSLSSHHLYRQSLKGIARRQAIRYCRC
jgi:hypothetical protein